MAIRVRAKANVRMYEDTSQTNILFAPDDTGSEQTIDTLDRGTSGVWNLAASATEVVAMDDVDDIRGLFIRANAGVNVVINGTITILLRPVDTVTGRLCKLYLDTVVTSISLINPSATATVQGVFAYWGDPTAT